jgi:hypothetical protein
VQTLQPALREQNTSKLSFQFVDQNGSGFLPTTVKLTLYLLGDETHIINNRNEQDVLNNNGVTIDSSGHLIWSIQPADLEIVGESPRGFETHVALFEWTWGVGQKGNVDYGLMVQKVALVP